MAKVISQGKNLRKAINEGKPLQIVGTINAYSALLAEEAGHKAIYLSGGGVAASSLGVPDLGITTLQDVLVIKAAVDAKTDQDFVIMARTDALANEGLESAIERAVAYERSGADALFPEALTEIEQYEEFKKHVNIPILANITEFGQTPLFSCEQLNKAGVDMVLYPLSAFRAMSRAAEAVYLDINKNGTQEGQLKNMQTRDELYDVLDYHSFENKLDELFRE